MYLIHTIVRHSSKYDRKLSSQETQNLGEKVDQANKL